jgi:hypothetical protein
MIERRKYNRMLKVVKYRWNQLLWHTDLMAVRFILAIGAISWGLTMLCNPNTLVISNMLAIMPSFAWVMLWLLQGSIMLWSLICDKRPRLTLWVDAVLGALLWSVSTIACLLYQYPGVVTLETIMEYYKVPPSLVPNIGLALASWWVLVRHYTKGDTDANF